MTATERQLARALRAGDRIAAINLAQRLWHAGDIRRTAVVAMHIDARTMSYPRAYSLYAIAAAV